MRHGMIVLFTTLTLLVTYEPVRAQDGDVCEPFERRYPVTACFTEGEHDEGDYRFKNDSHSGGVTTHGRLYNNSNGLGDRDRYLHCPLLEDSRTFRAQFDQVRVDGYDDQETGELEVRLCTTHPTGFGDFCTQPDFSGSFSAGLSLPSYRGEFRINLGLVGALANPDWYSYLTMKLPRRQDDFLVVVSGYRTLGRTLCVDDPVSRFSGFTPVGGTPSIKETTL